MNNRVCIDAGHGGKDSGAVHHGMLEKDLNLSLALKVQELLTRVGVEVIMTRETDIFVELSDRAKIANDNDVNIFVSLHRNAWTSPDALGVSTHIFPSSVRGRELGEVLQDAQLRAFKSNNRGIRESRFAVLRLTRMSANLLETGFMSNPDDAEKMKDSVVEDNTAYEVSKAISEFIGIEWDINEKEKDKPVSRMLYRVQIGAFRDKDNAIALGQKAKDAGFDVYIRKEGV